MKKADWPERVLVPENKLRDVLELYPGKTREEVRKLVFRELMRHLLPGIAAAVVFLLLALISGNKEPEEPGIARPAPGMAAVPVQIQVMLDGEQKSIPLEVGPREYEEAQLEELHREAVEYLATVVPAENESMEHITEALYFPKKLPLTGGEIYWTTDAPWLVTSEGEVLNETLSETVSVQITAEVFYGSESRFFSDVITVYPAVYTKEEALIRNIQKELADREEATRKTERFILPETVLGYQIEQAETTRISGSSFLVLLAVVLPLFLYSNYFGRLDTRKKEWKEEAERSYTELITKLSLMLAAGSSVRQAFVRLAEEYEKNHGPKHVLAVELKVTKQELENGGSERVVYEEFGRRIGVLPYRRMASLLTQNASKGVQGMRNLLLQEAKEVMAQERATIRQKGEQAGTKLLLPMMGLLLLVFAVLLVPAFQSF